MDLLFGAVPQWGGGLVLKTRDRDERPVGSNPTCVVFKEEVTMANEKTVFEVKTRNSQNNDSSSLSSFLTKEYQEAKENGFKGTIEEYLEIRDYT